MVVRTQLTVNLASLDVVADVLGAAAIDLAADGEGSTEDLQDGTLEALGHGAVTHGASNLNNVVEGDRLAVLDVLLLLAVTRGLLEGLDDQRRGGGDNRDSGLTVLDGQTHSHTQTLPVASVLGNVFTNLLGRQTERTDLGSQSGLGSDLTTSHTQVNDLHLIGVELGSCIREIMLVAIGNTQGDDTYAWRVRKVVNLPWVVEGVDGRRRKISRVEEKSLARAGTHMGSPKRMSQSGGLGQGVVT